MIRGLRACLRRFGRSESGSATIEFAITFPAMLFFLLSGVELGMITLNQAMLERSIDMTVRDIRLGTGAAPQHDEIKDTICERAGFIEDCADNMRLEMIQVDPYNWNGLSGDPDCIDRSEDVAPVRSFVNGQSNELMILRACVKIAPMFPTVGLGATIGKDGAGNYALYATAAFVQEPG